MNIPTSESLIDSIRQPDNKAAWDRFYQLYAPLIKTYALRRGCTQEMSDDVLQSTFINLLKTLPRFQYRPERGHFRGYLYAILKSRISKAFKEQKRLRLARSDTEHAYLFDDREALNASTPCQSWDDLWEFNLTRQAYEQVKRNIAENGNSMTIEIFELFVFQELSAREVRDRIKEKYKIEVSENKIFQDKSRVIRIWKSELRKLRYEVGDA